MPYVLYLDRYHLGDVLFLQSLTRAMGGARAAGLEALVVHGSGEEAERLLEGEGYFVAREGGVLQVTSAVEAALVDRAVRQLNRRLVSLFTDAVVATVGVVGTDRGLLRAQSDGGVALHRPEWLLKLVRQGVVPVVGAVARAADGTGAGEVDAASVALAAAQALGAGTGEEVGVACFTQTNLPGVMDGRSPRARIRVSELPDEGLVPEPEAVRRFVAAGVPVLLTNTARLVDRGGPTGTRVVP